MTHEQENVVVCADDITYPARPTPGQLAIPGDLSRYSDLPARVPGRDNPPDHRRAVTGIATIRTPITADSRLQLANQNDSYRLPPPQRIRLCTKPGSSTPCAPPALSASPERAPTAAVTPRACSARCWPPLPSATNSIPRRLTTSSSAVSPRWASRATASPAWPPWMPATTPPPAAPPWTAFAGPASPP